MPELKRSCPDERFRMRNSIACDVARCENLVRLFEITGGAHLRQACLDLTKPAITGCSSPVAQSEPRSAKISV